MRMRVKCPRNCVLSRMSFEILSITSWRIKEVYCDGIQDSTRFLRT